MVTGDFLFEPRREVAMTKDEDHLAQMMELLEECPATWQHQARTRGVLQLARSI